MHNIGHDGTGVHSNIENMYTVQIAKHAVKQFPDIIKEDEQAYRAIKYFLKSRKGSLLNRGIRFIIQLKARYLASKKHFINI